MLTFLLSMSCTSKMHPFSLGNLMIIRVTSVDVDDVAPPIIWLSDAKRHASLLSSFSLEESL